MFHLLLVLPVLIVLGLLIAILLCAIVALVSAIVGGTTVALLIKNPTTKKLLLIGFLVLFLAGVLCLTPLLIIYFALPASLLMLIVAAIYVAMIALSLAGIKISCSVHHKVGKVLLIILFCVVLIAAVSMGIVTALGAHFFMRPAA